MIWNGYEYTDLIEKRCITFHLPFTTRMILVFQKRLISKKIAELSYFFTFWNVSEEDDRHTVQ